MRVEYQFRIWEFGLQGKYQRLELFLFKTGKDALSQEEDRAWTMLAYQLQLGRIEKRDIQKMATFTLLADEYAAKINHVRQIEVIPFDTAIAHAFEAGIEAASDLDDHTIGVSRKEITNKAIEFAQAQDDGQFIVPLQFDAREVIIQLIDYRNGSIIHLCFHDDR